MAGVLTLKLNNYFSGRLQGRDKLGPVPVQIWSDNGSDEYGLS